MIWISDGVVIMQTSLMIVIAVTCFASAGDWGLIQNNMSAALAFVGFGLGYVGLVWLFT